MFGDYKEFQYSNSAFWLDVWTLCSYLDYIFFEKDYHYRAQEYLKLWRVFFHAELICVRHLPKMIFLFSS